MNLANAVHHVGQAAHNGADIRLRFFAAAKGPVRNPHRTRERPHHQHVVRTGELDVKASLVSLDGIGTPRSDGRRGARLREKLDRHVLEQVGDLSITHGILEGLAPVAHTYVLDDMGHEIIDARRGNEILAGHKWSSLDNAHACGQVLQTNPDPLDFYDLCHELEPSPSSSRIYRKHCTSAPTKMPPLPLHRNARNAAW